jgi:Bacterial membrane protein YfhO
MTEGTNPARADLAAADGHSRLSAWIPLTALVGFFLLALPFFVGRVYVADDLGEFHLPLRNFYARQLALGEPFDWMPSLYGGFYVAAEGQLGAYHPLHLLLYRLMPLGAAFDVELLISYPLIFMGTYWFLKRLVRRSYAAMYGALAFTFCGFNLLHFVHPNAVAVMAHLPWLLLSIDVALGKTAVPARAIARVCVGLLTASQLLLGYPQYVWFSLLVEVAFAAWRIAVDRPRRSAIAMLLAAQLAGVLLAGVQLVPTTAALSDSVRNTADPTFAATGSLHPLNLVQLLAPYLFRSRVVGQNTHELGLYAGAVPLLLCVWLWCHRRALGQRRGLVIWLVVLGAGAMLLAMGEFGGLYCLQSFVPLANRFRFPCRAIVIVQFCIAALAAVAMAMLIEGAANRETAKRPPGRRPLALVFLASVLLAVLGPLAWRQYVADPLLIWCGPILIGSAALLIALAERGMRGAVVALAVFTAVDLCSYGFSYSIYGRTSELRDFVSRIALPPAGPPTRVLVDDGVGRGRTGDRMLLAGLDRVDGYAGLEPAKVLDYRQTAAQRLAGVAWVLKSSAQPPSAQWTPVLAPAPRLRLVTRTADQEVLSDLDRLDADAAVVDEPLSLPPGTPGNARIIFDEPGRITIETATTSRQLLVMTESFHDGWQASVADRPLRVMRVNGDFLGCVVEAGTHRVTLEFRPFSRRLGATLSACGLGLTVCLLGLSLPWPRCRDRMPPLCRVDYLTRS